MENQPLDTSETHIQGKHSQQMLSQLGTTHKKINTQPTSGLARFGKIIRKSEAQRTYIPKTCIFKAAQKVVYVYTCTKFTTLCQWEQISIHGWSGMGCNQIASLCFFVGRGSVGSRAGVHGTGMPAAPGKPNASAHETPPWMVGSGCGHKPPVTPAL